MSIKIEGGNGTAENVIKAGTSNELLYNDKEVILKENLDLDLGLGLLPPDLSKTEKHELIGTQDNESTVYRRLTVPEDGWIIKLDISEPVTDYIEIDGYGDIGITPSQELIYNIEDKYVFRHNINCPYPVKKGQVVIQEHGHVKPKINHSYITFAPCMSVQI